MRKILFTLILSALVFSCATQQDAGLNTGSDQNHTSLRAYKSRYLELIRSGDFEALEEHLADWEAVSAEDPELFIAYFNYYINIARNEQTGVFENPPSRGEYMVVQGENDEPIGYMYSKIVYDAELSERALSYLARGIELYPDRLDMHLGAVYALGNLERYRDQADYIQVLLKEGKDNGNIWYWSDYQPLEKSEEEIMLIYSDYYKLWTEIATEYTIELLRETAQLQLDLYPEIVYGYNFLSQAYQYTGQYDLALKTLLEALERFPEDYIIVHNIGLAYENMGDKDSALEYYSMLKNYPDLIDQNYVESIISRVSPDSKNQR
jgi:tetratricopeptide (TPR) repeat protein